MLASCHYKLTVPYCSDKLKSFASGILICCTVSLDSFDGMLATACDLLSFIVLTC